MSGEATGAAAALLRGALSIAEPFYAGATTLRNRLFDYRLKSVIHLPRPVISVGNITAGGTGKTPMVRWLAAYLREQGKQVAILSRGYKSTNGGLGDELTMLDRALNGHLGAPPILLRANPNRSATGTALIAQHPEVDVILLDDGFQHRRVARNLDIVLINAAEPFGFEHVLPRGLLREPLQGLRRAGAIVLTHCDRVSEETLVQIEQRIRDYTMAARVTPIVRSAHTQIGFRSATTPLQAPVDEPMSALETRRWFLFCGIAGPEALREQLQSHGGECVGTRSFSDHHDFTGSDVRQIISAARAAGADVLLTTEKDWVKIEPIWRTIVDPMPLWRVDMEIRFAGDGASVMAALVKGVLTGWSWATSAVEGGISNQCSPK